MNQRSLPPGKPGPDVAGDSAPSLESSGLRALFFFFLFQFIQREMKIDRRAGKRGQSEPQTKQVYDDFLVLYSRFLVLIRHIRIPLSAELLLIIIANMRVPLQSEPVHASFIYCRQSR